MRLFQHDLEEALSIMNIQIGFSIHFDILYIYIYTHKIKFEIEWMIFEDRKSVV